MDRREKEIELEKLIQRAMRPLVDALFERMCDLMAKNQTDLDNSIAALKTAVANLTANPPASVDLTSEVTDIDAATAAIAALTPTPAPAPAPAPVDPTTPPAAQ